MRREVRLVARVLRVVEGDIEAEGFQRELDVMRARVSRAAEQDCVLGVGYACCRYQVERPYLCINDGCPWHRCRSYSAWAAFFGRSC